jgi:hypothetical protein
LAAGSPPRFPASQVGRGDCTLKPARNIFTGAAIFQATKLKR